MAFAHETSWLPTEILRVEGEPARTSTAPVVVVTDAGRGFAKLLGNPEGPSALAVELVGTRLAAALGLPVAPVALLDWPEDLAVDLGGGCRSEPGTCFVTQALEGHSWDGTATALRALANPEQIANIVALDTLTRHRDRYFARGSEIRRNLGNVFLRRDPVGRPEQRTLVALDQSACFRGSASLSPAVLTLGDIEDPQLYGLFPEFVAFMDPDAVAAVEVTLRTFARQCRRFVEGIPRDWRVGVPTIERMTDFLDARARFLSQRFHEMVEDASSPQRSLRFPGGQA